MIGNWVDLGVMEYAACTELQRHILDRVLAEQLPHTLLIVEHPPVLTLGASFQPVNLLYPPEFYTEKGIALHKTERGGDVTYHGPGQLVGYPIFNVAELGKDLHKWLRDLEEAVILSLRPFGIEGYRSDVNTGVWVDEKKICAIGIKMRRWVSMHGIALNCSNDLKPFEYIVPCGIKTHGVTSISEQLGREVTQGEVLPHLIAGFESVFGIQLTESERAQFVS
ncbi:MAG: lipoyl(octanoyl) transferase LipB [Fimbriimonadaceae bacterium]|nr:lipoyl(octanoyl) transferase LipB [Fimbriimonadaceae bacterium]